MIATNRIVLNASKSSLAFFFQCTDVTMMSYTNSHTIRMICVIKIIFNIIEALIFDRIAMNKTEEMVLFL